VFGNADYDMTIIAHVEPRDLATIWADPEYYTRYDNPQVQQLLADGDAGTPEEFVADNRAAVELLAQDAAAAWLWSLPNLLVADADVRGLPENALGESFDLADLSVG
jgi:peptide/nickel transport system substrate-binding protein